MGAYDIYWPYVSMGHDGGAGWSQTQSKSVICPKSGHLAQMVRRIRQQGCSELSWKQVSVLWINQEARSADPSSSKAASDFGLRKAVWGAYAARNQVLIPWESNFLNLNIKSIFSFLTSFGVNVRLKHCVCTSQTCHNYTLNLFRPLYLNLDKNWVLKM